MAERANDHVGFDESFGDIKTTAIPWDYFHVNSICVDPTGNNLVISGRNRCAFTRWTVAIGAVLWRLG